jgi:hypothetical protein
VTGTQHDVASIGTPACVYCTCRGTPPDSCCGRAASPTNSKARRPEAPVLPAATTDGDTGQELCVRPSRPEHIREPGVEGKTATAVTTPTRPRTKFLKMTSQAEFCWNCHFRPGQRTTPWEWTWSRRDASAGYDFRPEERGLQRHTFVECRGDGAREQRNVLVVPRYPRRPAQYQDHHGSEFTAGC